jgi:hypothetical protein
MKKNFLTLFVILLAYGSTHAQFEDQKWVLGGSASARFFNSNDQENSTSLYDITLVDGYALNESSVIGIITSFSNSRNELTGTNTSFDRNTTNFNVGVLYRKYWTLKENLYFFSQGYIVYTTGSSESTSNGTSSSSSLSGFSAAITPGVSVRLTDWVVSLSESASSVSVILV